MNEKIEKAIENCLTSIRSNQMKADDALKFSQAALNLAHTFNVLKQPLEPVGKSKGAGS